MDPERVRRDFPFYTTADGPATAYLDNACTTLKPAAVVDAVAEYHARFPVCGERSVHRLSRRVTQAVEAGRQRLAEHTGAAASEDVVFTKNATEAINTVAHGLDWAPGDVVITTDKEHNSNFVPWLRLADTEGVDHRVVPTADDGAFDTDRFAEAVEQAGDRLRLASLTHVSNVDGAVVPVRDAARRVHDAGGLVLVDAAQSAAHGPCGLGELDADFVALSLHKMLGPSGVGALVATESAWEAVAPLMLGGGTVAQSGPAGYELAERPARFEAGLGNYAGLVAVEAGLDYLDGLGLESVAAHDAKLNERATKALADVEGVRVLGPSWRDRTSILPFVVDGLDPLDVAVYLDERADVAVRAGAHCVHSYFERRGLTGSVRASFHTYNTADDVDRLTRAVSALADRLRTARASR